MDNNEDILEIRDSQQREDEVPAWTHPAFADAVRAADLTRNQYLQLAARRRAQQSQQSQQQIPQPYHWQTPQQSHQQNYQRSYQPGHQQSPSHGHQQSYQPGHQQSQSHSHPHGHQQSYQQQQHYSRMETLQTFQNQHHQHRQSPAPVLHFPESSNKAFSPSQFGQPQSATIAQPPRPSTERSISDSREEYINVRPSDIGSSMSHYGVKPLRQTSVPVTTQAQALPSMQATTGENSVQPATQSQYQVAHNRPSSNPRSTNSSHSTQGRLLSTFHPSPSIAPPRSDVARDQRQQVPPAKAKEVEANVNYGRPVAKPQSTKHHGKSPADTAMNTESSPKRDPYNSATRTTINIRPEDQDQVIPKNSSSTANKPSQDPIHPGLHPASHLPANTSTSAISTQTPPTATTIGYSTKASHRASPGQSALAELNRFKAKGAKGPKNSDVQARNSPGPPHPVQQARNQGQSPPLNAPHAPLQRSASVPQQAHESMQPPSHPTRTPAVVANESALQRPASVPQQAHDSMQTPSHPARMPAIGANESATPSSQRNLSVNSQVTRDENLSRDHYSHTTAESQSTSSTPLSEAPPKQISQVISNALPSINREWNRWAQPEKLPAQNGSMPPPPPPPRGGQPPVGRAMPESMPPPKVRRLEDGSKQGKSLKAIHPDNHLKKIRQGTSLKQRNDLIQPFDPNQADSRAAYDPATIARDVLIVASKHPTEERLNHHLAILMKSFPSVDASKDLATLRWDLIDPVIPRDSTAHRPPARVSTQPISAPSSLFPNRVEYRPSPQYLPPSLPVSAQSHYPGPIPFQHRPISWAPVAISGPPPPPPPLPFPPPPFAAPQAPPLSHYAPAPAPKPKPGPKPTPKAPKQPKVRKSQGPAVVKATPPPTPAVVIDLSPRPKGPVESPRTQKTPSVAVVIDSPRRMDPIKRRGRPKKDDKGTDAEGSAASGKKSHPEYPVFNCQWEKCQAQLHNLSVLQDHALKIHIPHNIMCGWKDCENKTPMAAAAMWEHVRDSHIKNLAWTHGDGPAVSAFAGDNNEPPELSMSSFPGLNRNARPGTVILPAESQVVNAYSRVHGISNTKDKAVLLKEAGCRWKEDTGPDVDFSDCRLAIPTRLSSSSVAEFAVTTSDSS